MIKKDFLISELSYTAKPNIYTDNIGWNTVKCSCCKKDTQILRVITNYEIKIDKSIASAYGNVYVQSEGASNFWATSSFPELLISNHYHKVKSFFCKACIESELLLPGYIND